MSLAFLRYETLKFHNEVYGQYHQHIDSCADGCNFTHHYPIKQPNMAEV